MRDFPSHKLDVIVDEVGLLSQFALTVLYVHKIDDDNVMASLRRFIAGSTAVACQTLNLQKFSLGRHRFLEQLALVGKFVKTFRHVEVLK